jgi:hypothetical protein
MHPRNMIRINQLIALNQNVNSGEWVSIGEFEFKGDGTEEISVTAGGSSTVADAVRLLKVELRSFRLIST